MKQETKNPHGWLYRHLSQVCDSFDTEEAKKDLVNRYSYGKTNSLSVMFTQYPSLYYKMKRDLSPEKHYSSSELDMPRKRLIAVIFERLAQQGITGVGCEYVKKVACQAAKVSNFNDIQLNQLKSLYRKFGEKNQAEWIKELTELIKP